MISRYLKLAVLMFSVVMFCGKDPASTDPDDLRDELKARGSVSGYVCDRDGNPIENVWVDIDSTKGTPDATDENGFFSVKEVINGTVRLTFIHHNYEAESQEVTVGFAVDDTLTDTVQMSWAFYRIAGRVLQNGEPVEGAGVAVAGTHVSTLTKSDGSFQLDHIPQIEKVKLICARNPGGYALFEVDDTLSVDSTTKVGEITIDKKGTDVQGTVYDISGDPLPWITVKAVGGGVWAQTDALGKYYLSNVPAGEENVRISVVTRDSTLIGSVSGLKLDSGAVASGVDIYMRRITDLANGMFLEVQDLILPDTVEKMQLAVFPVTDSRTVIDEYLWYIGDTILTTGQPQCSVDLEKIEKASSVSVRSRNKNGQLSDRFPISVVICSSKPMIRKCGVSQGSGLVLDSITVNLGQLFASHQLLQIPSGGSIQPYGFSVTDQKPQDRECSLRRLSTSTPRPDFTLRSSKC